MSVNHQLMTYGYMLDQDAFNAVKTADSADIIEFHNEAITWLRDITGGKHSFRSLYGNFPNDVLSMTQAELFWNQIFHYWTACTFPETGRPKDVAFEHVTYKMLTAGNDKRFMQIFTDLCSVGQSLTPTDTETLKWFANSGLDLKFPDKVPFKENLATLATILPQFKVSTVTDVLRIAVGFSGGDVSLPAVPRKPKKVNRFAAERLTERKKFKFKLTLDQKTRVLDLLENSNLDVREMNQGRRYGRWIRLGEVLGQIDKIKYPRTANAFYRLRNQKRKGKPEGEAKVRTWYSDVETAFKLDFATGLAKLAERPGEFVRRLDALVRKNQKDQVKIKNILLTLSVVAEKVSNKVLFEVFTHFEGRTEAITNRSIFVKGARSRTALPNLPKIDVNVIEAIKDTIITAVKSKFKDLAPMGSCWIDPELKKIPMPTNMRSMSDSLVPVIRGQRMPFGTGKKVIRPFVHWFDENGNEDIDLHGFLLGEKKATTFGYNGERSNSYGQYSGDVRHRRGACAEYVDIVVDNAVNHGYKYFVMVVHNFSNRSLASIKECVAGVMERETATANSTWKPDTITNAMRLTSASKMCLVGVYDLETREYIHLDLDWNTFSQYVSGRSDSNALFKAIEPYISLPKFSVYDLLKWHVDARGTNAGIESADTHFKFDDFKSSYVEVMKLMGV